ncbi:MAG TPA: glycosyltransferase [Kiritimatiellia bacterium]|nr:glycosyltransferase [Kiritimatiellia bacterium]HMP35796.1 glycosyltransferase [Kiritimatiellia bacterium]
MPAPQRHPSATRPVPGRISVAIPVLNAEKYLPTLLPAILGQKPVAPDEVILVDSNSTDRTREIAATFDQVRVIPIARFSHGGSRNLGAAEATGDFVVFLSQDATPRGDDWLEKLLIPFEDPQVAATYSRQVPYPDANPMERYFLETHFPPGLAVRRAKEGHKPLALHDVFLSNVSAAYRRQALLDHPFDEELIMSEDQQISRDLLNAGYAVVYQPASVVTHSHNYTLNVVFRRYFDSVYSLTLVFPKHDMGTSASMGFSYLGREFMHMLTKHPLWIPYYACYTVAKTLGTLAGHFAEKMPRAWARRCSLHRYHWR